MNHLKNITLSSSGLCNCRSNSGEPITTTTTTTRRASAATQSPLLLPKGLRSPHKKNRRNNNNATDVLRLMDSLQFPIPVDTYASLLRECIDSRDAVGGAEVHAHIERSARRRPLGLLLSNRLLLTYASCGRLDDAIRLFDKMTSRDFISWLTMIAGHVDHDDPEEALLLFKQMLMQLQQPELRKVLSLESKACWVIIPSLLKACIHTKDFGLGEQLHGLLLKLGHGENLFLCSLFIAFYAKLRCLESARRVFDQALCRRPRPDTVIWTAMMSGYCREGRFEEVIELFKKMGRAGAKKNNFTISTVMRACGRIRCRHDDDDDGGGDEGWCGKQVHANAIKLGLVESDLFVQSSLVDMYGKCGLVKDARVVFETIGSRRRNDVCWNAMLDSYTRHGSYNEAIKLLYSMKAAGIQPQESMLNTLRIAFGGS